MRDIEVMLGAAIRRARLRRGLTQADLAADLRWPHSRVIRAENAQCHVRVEELPGLCRVLGVSLAVLLDEAPRSDLEALGLLDCLTVPAQRSGACGDR